MFGWCARERARADGPWAQPAITLVLLFLGMVLAPASLYFYLVHPAWSWLYLVDPARVPRVVVLTVLAAQAAALMGGYYGAARLVRAGKEIGLRIGLAAGAVVLLVLLLLARGRITSYGSYAQYHDGQALGIMAVKLGYVLIAVVIGSSSAAAVVAWELYRDGRRAAAR
jgi:hypothetical protein